MLPNGRRCGGGGRKNEGLGKPYTFEDMVAEAERKRESHCGGKTDGGRNCIDTKLKCDAPDRRLQEVMEASENDTRIRTCPSRRPLPPLPPLQPLPPERKRDAGIEAKGGKNRRRDEGKKCVVLRRHETNARRRKETPRESDLPSESVRVKLEPKEDEGESVSVTDTTHHPVIFSSGGSVGVVTGQGGGPTTSLSATAFTTAASAAHVTPPYTIRLNLAGLQHVKPTIVIISTGKGKPVQVLLISVEIAYCHHQQQQR